MESTSVPKFVYAGVQEHIRLHARRRRHAYCICMNNLVYPPPNPTEWVASSFLFTHISSVEIDRVLRNALALSCFIALF